jgi:CRISPR/Cas system-associated exonuclease Cas4 (RecB family)
LTFSELTPDGVPSELRFSASRLAAYDGCKRRHHYTYRKGYRVPYTNDAMTYGSIIHRLLELHYKDGTSPAEAYTTVSEEFPTYKQQMLIWPAITLITRYISFFEKKDNFQVLGVEKELVVPYSTPNGVTVYLHGLIDLVGVLPSDELFIMDHKSSARRVWNKDKVWLDHQIAFYMCLMLQCGFDPRIGVINQISSASKDAGKIGNYNPNDLFSRFSVKPSPVMLENWLREFGQKIDVILEEKVYPKSLSNKCSDCPFFEACLLEMRGDDPTPWLETNFREDAQYEIQVEIEGLDD